MFETPLKNNISEPILSRNENEQQLITPSLDIKDKDYKFILDIKDDLCSVCLSPFQSHSVDFDDNNNNNNEKSVIQTKCKVYTKIYILFTIIIIILSIYSTRLVYNNLNV